MSKNKSDEAFVMLPQSLLESFAWRALSHAGQLVVSRIMVEHMRHRGTENGRLKVRKTDFIEYGVHNNSVAPALREACALGLISLAKRGRAGNAEHRSAHEWSLNFVKDQRTKAMVGTAWKRFQSLPEAMAIAAEARKKKDTYAVAAGKRRAARLKAKLIYFPVRKSRPESETFSGPEKPTGTGPGIRTTAPVRESGPLSISPSPPPQRSRGA
jgi:hypothetical protein